MQTSQSYTKIIIFTLVALIIGVNAGIVIGKVFFENNKSSEATTQSIPTADQHTLDDPTTILQNKVFTEWLGSVEGTLIEKNTDSLVIEKDGEKLKIYLQDNLTKFMKRAPGANTPEFLQLEEIPVGTYLRGGVTISRNTLTDVAGQHIVANGFTIVEDIN